MILFPHFFAHLSPGSVPVSALFKLSLHTFLHEVYSLSLTLSLQKESVAKKRPGGKPLEKGFPLGIPLSKPRVDYTRAGFNPCGALLVGARYNEPCIE